MRKKDFKKSFLTTVFIRGRDLWLCDIKDDFSLIQVTDDGTNWIDIPNSTDFYGYRI
ncbi:MAG: hypothetical protein ACYS9Y_12505 [Planctomycetota bacterium]